MKDTVMIRWMNKLSNTLFTRNILFMLLGAQNVMGIVTIFANPLPIPPRTSIGLLTGVMILILLFFIILLKKKIIFIREKLHIADWIVVGFIITNALSLIVSPYIFDLTNFRLLCIAAIQYAAVRMLVFSDHEKRRMFLVIGITTLGIAVISLFQMIFREQAIVFARRFLFGDSAFSIATDLARGRGPLWGCIVVSFPFFIGSALFWRKSRALIRRIYILLGIFLIPFSFIVSNFRWFTICFFVGISFYFILLYKNKLLSLSLIKKILIPFLVAVTCGMLLASVVFQYNLIDRFLFKVKERDITDTVGRLFLYGQAFSAFSASPFFGIGTGSYRYTIERPLRLHYYQFITEEGRVDIQNREPVSSHNDLLTMLAEIGFVGILFYGALNFFVIRHLIWALRISMRENKQTNIVYSLTLLTALITFYLVGLFENSAPNNFVFIFFLYAASVTWFPFIQKTVPFKK